jgi:hypothetical protein
MKLFMDKISDCSTLKDQIIRDSRRDLDANLHVHESLVNESNNYLKQSIDILNGTIEDLDVDYDPKRIDQLKIKISKTLEMNTSLIVSNNREIDALIVKILQHMNMDGIKSDTVKINKVKKEIEEIELRSKTSKRDDTLQCLYDYFKSSLTDKHDLRATMRSSLFQGEVDLIDLNTLIAKAEENYKTNPYGLKLIQVEKTLRELMDLTIEKINLIKVDTNTLRMKFAKRNVDQNSVSFSEINKDYDLLISEIQKMDQSFFELISMDICLFCAILAKSFQYINRKVTFITEALISIFVNAENSYAYLKLLNLGSKEIPEKIELFILNFKKTITRLHKENVEHYLINDFSSDTSEYSQDEGMKRIIVRNYNFANKTLSLSVECLNSFVDELHNGKNKTGVNYTLFNRHYPSLMMKVSPRLNALEEYK